MRSVTASKWMRSRSREGKVKVSAKKEGALQKKGKGSSSMRWNRLNRLMVG